MSTSSDLAWRPPLEAETGLIGRRHAKPFSGGGHRSASPPRTTRETPVNPSENIDVNDTPPLEESLRESSR